ncbi:hypothetical protein K461DRAFT_64883 [Myriangium duriaei CBS 260.36]|uniref:Uncharacterized protein n=1 Tax=Myriangium duriaei CBS 260.36 TaxID=1168546 RepID=A0A9P4ITM2_9PEZI|nr:hypothetical protein K461DRAFT_64883 [Myriangium duriaei CBS 260.36]
MHSTPSPAIYFARGGPDSFYPIGKMSSVISVPSHNKLLPVAACGLLTQLAVNFLKEGTIEITEAGATLHKRTSYPRGMAGMSHRKKPVLRQDHFVRSS